MFLFSSNYILWRAVALVAEKGRGGNEIWVWIEQVGGKCKWTLH